MKVTQRETRNSGNGITTNSKPFNAVGVDYFGPLEVAVGSRTEKRYGAIVVCVAIRAIYTEITTNLTTDCMMMSLKRFLVRRGNPEEITPDNGTNLIGANNELIELVIEI